METKNQTPNLCCQEKAIALVLININNNHPDKTLSKPNNAELKFKAGNKQ